MYTQLLPSAIDGGKISKEIFALRHYVYKEMMMMMMITSQSSLQNYLLLPPELCSNHSTTARSHLLAMVCVIYRFSQGQKRSSRGIF